MTALEIRELRQVLERVEEEAGIDACCDEKINDMRYLVNLAGSRNMLQAWYNCRAALRSEEEQARELQVQTLQIQEDSKSKTEKVSSLKCELEQISGQSSELEGQLKLLELSQSALQSNLIRLRAKAEAIMARATGAELQHQSVLNRMRSAKVDADARIANVVSEIQSIEKSKTQTLQRFENSERMIVSEIRNLQEVLERQIHSFEVHNRIKFSSA